MLILHVVVISVSVVMYLDAYFVQVCELSPDNNIIEAAKGADLLIHEATFASEMKEDAAERMHSTAEDAAVVAKKAGVKKLLLTHISPRYSDSGILLEEARRVFRNTEMAEDGMAIDLR